MFPNDPYADELQSTRKELRNNQRGQPGTASDVRSLMPSGQTAPAMLRMEMINPSITTSRIGAMDKDVTPCTERAIIVNSGVF